MTNEEEVIIDPINDTEEVDVETEVEVDANDKEESVDDKKSVETPEAKQARLKRQLEQHNKKYGFTEAPTKKSQVTKEATLSTKDTIALIEAKVSSEDFDEVIDFANYRKINVADALKSSVLKAILSEKAEERQTAAATQSRGSRTSPKVTDDAIIEKARKGQFPESDEGIAQLAAAQQRAFLAKRKK